VKEDLILGCKYKSSVVYTLEQYAFTMAKSDSFFIRAGLTDLTGNVFTTESVDLGAFVDALGRTVLRIHNISVQYDFSGAGPEVVLANTEGRVAWQLTTQDQGGMILASNRSMVSSGHLDAANNSGVGNTFTFVTQDLDIAPQEWTGGYLVAVESLQLAGKATGFTSNCNVSLVLECTSETMTAAASMALALSQQ
jgi:hypothetical protein